MGRKKLFANTDLVEMFPLYSYEDNELDRDEVFKEFRKIYTTFYVSVFDHWLNEEQYIQEPVVSADEVMGKSKRNNPNWEIYQEYENRFSKFYDALYKKGVHVLYKKYARRWTNRESRYLIRMSSYKEYRRYYLYDVRETHFWRSQQYVVPSLGVMVEGNEKLTHIVHANPKYFQKEEFEDIVRRSGLYILPNAETNDEN